MPQPYLSLEAELHDAFWDAEDDGSELRLMADFLKTRPGSALEVGSGSGRLMFPLVQQNFDIEGLELSTDMIALGETRAKNLGVRPVVHNGDMTHWRGTRRYDHLLAPAFTLQLAPDPATTLRHWRELLADNGRLYLTVFMPYAELLGDLPENEWYPDHQATLPNGRNGILETRHCIDKKAQLLYREHRYSVTGPHPASHQSSQIIRWIEHREMLTLLKETGFHIDHYFLDFDPKHTPEDPDKTDFNGILTYHATRTEIADTHPLNRKKRAL